jgi:hypothetical protein
VWQHGRPLGRDLPYWWPWLLAGPLAWQTHLLDTKATHFSETISHVMCSIPVSRYWRDFCWEAIRDKERLLIRVTCFISGGHGFESPFWTRTLCDYTIEDVLHEALVPFVYVPEAYVTQFSFYWRFLNCSVQRAVWVGGEQDIVNSLCPAREEDDFFGLQWNSFCSFHFRAQKSFDFQGPPLHQIISFRAI